jgi:hypothetical protein
MMMDFSVALFSGFELSSSLLHVLGGGVGLAVGGVALGKGLVDCDGQDVLSRYHDALGRPVVAKPKKPSAEELAEFQSERAKLAWKCSVIEKSLDQHLAAGSATESIAAMKQLRSINPQAEWTEPRLRRLLSLLQQAKKWDDVLYHLQVYIERFPGPAACVAQLQMARIWLLEKDRPRKALTVLTGIDAATLTEPQRRALVEIRRAATHRLAEGDLDFAD